MRLVDYGVGLFVFFIVPTGFLLRSYDLIYLHILLGLEVFVLLAMCVIDLSRSPEVLQTASKEKE